MGLFSRRNPQVIEQSLKALPDPTSINLEIIRKFPKVTDSDLTDAAWAALNRAYSDGFPAAEPDFRRLLDQGGSADAAFATGELGAFLTDNEPGSVEWSEGVSFLVAALNLPYKDSVSSAAWNVSALLSNMRVDEYVPLAEAFAELAVELEEPMALLVTAEQRLAKGDHSEEVRMRLEGAIEVMGTGPALQRARKAMTVFDIKKQAEPLQDWFVAAQEAFPSVAFTEMLAYFIVRGHYNVEGGSASISTRIFGDSPDCDCYYSNHFVGCDICARTIFNFNEVCAGMGDGVYPALLLADSTEEHTIVGAMTVFQDAADDLPEVGLASSIEQILMRGAPLILGKLTCEGTLFFSDSSTCYDSNNLIVDVDVAAGEYLVVVWATTPLSMDDTMRPLAFGAFTGPLADLIQDSLPFADPAVLIPLMWGKPDLTVQAHMMPVTEPVAAHNFDQDREEEPLRALSWVIQSAESGGQEAIQFLNGEEIDFDEALLKQVALRGVRTIRAQWWSPTGNPSTDVICAAVIAAGDELTSKSQVRELACHASPWVRRVVATREDLAIDLLRQFSSDSDDYVRTLIAQRSDLPSDILARMADDSSPEVRALVSGNPDTPVEVLTRLAERTEFAAGLLGNEALPLDAAVKLIATAASPSGRQAFAARDDVPIEMLSGYEHDESEDVRQTVAGHSRIAVEMQRTLADDRSVWVRLCLASNPVVNGETITLLSRDESSMVRRKIAERVDAPIAALATLAEDSEAYVRQAVYENISTPHESKLVAERLGLGGDDNWDLDELEDDTESHGVWDDTDELFELFRQAKQLSSLGDYEGAMTLWERDSRRGGSWSLASATWAALVGGDPARGTRIYDESFDRCETFVEACLEADEDSSISETSLVNLINARSNAALCRIACGGALQEAREIWLDLAEFGHAESLFYPTVVAFRLGSPEQARALLKTLEPDILEEMRVICTDGLEAIGWFADWSRDGLGLLDQVPCSEIDDSVEEWSLNSASMEELRELHEAGNDFASCMLGNRLWERGDRESAIAIWRETAWQGSAASLASLTWSLLTIGEHRVAREAFEEFFNRVEIYTEGIRDASPEELELDPEDKQFFFEMQLLELANSVSNDALNRAALAEDAAELDFAWQQSESYGHVESTLHRAILAHRSGKARQCSELLNKLSSDERAECLAIVESNCVSASDWFAGWCRDGVSILGGNVCQEGSGTATSRFCVSCGSPRDLEDVFCGTCGKRQQP